MEAKAVYFIREDIVMTLEVEEHPFDKDFAMELLKDIYCHDCTKYRVDILFPPETKVFKSEWWL